MSDYTCEHCNQAVVHSPDRGGWVHEATMATTCAPWTIAKPKKHSTLASGARKVIGDEVTDDYGWCCRTCGKAESGLPSITEAMRAANEHERFLDVERV